MRSQRSDSLLLLSFSCFLFAPISSEPSTCLPHSLRVPSAVQYRSRKLVIAHRGASYHLPEHTTAAYRLALELGADWIEADVVASSDGVLFCLHSVDLAVTSNVEEVFPNQTWYSPVLDRTGYWIFNFTADQVDQLKVKQRLSESRSTAFDGTMHIPRLEGALRVLNDWNANDLMQRIPPSVVMNDTTKTTKARKPTFVDLARSGMYMEFKDYTIVKEEAGLDLVDLLYDHIDQFTDLWKPLLEDQCYSVMRFDEYVVPGLVLQSFEVAALSRFHERWSLHFSNDWNQSNTSLRVAPEPPYVLLLDHHGCTEDLVEEFWFHVGTTWRTFLSGIGCDKQCLFDNEEFAYKAESFKLVLHPWTERPEQTFLVDATKFPNVLQETRHLFCKIPAVHGIFSESVSIAVTAALMGCDDGESDQGEEKKPLSDQNKTTTICYDSDRQAALYSELVSFAMGVLIAASISAWAHRRKKQHHYTGRTAVASNDDEDCGDNVELT